MSDNAPEHSFLWLLFSQLRRPLALDIRDYHDLRRAVSASFGWMSPQDLRDVCCALWSKSLSEQHLVERTFDRLLPEHWTWNLEHEVQEAEEASRPNSEGSQVLPDTGAEGAKAIAQRERAPSVVQVDVRRQGGLPDFPMPDIPTPNRGFIFQPHYPLTERDVAQAWRRLRQPVRAGAPVDLDIDATISRRVRTGVISPAVLLPRRYLTARVLLLVDRQGSMTPFHGFVDEVVSAIQKANRLENAHVFYFRNLPTTNTDDSVLSPLRAELFPVLDTLMPSIPPNSKGIAFTDKELLHPESLDEVLRLHAVAANVILISDAGAARRRYNVLRLLNTLAFVKGLREYTTRYVWLNPLPEPHWAHTTAEQIARHVPMFPMNRDGLHEAITALRSQRYNLEAAVQ